MKTFLNMVCSLCYIKIIVQHLRHSSVKPGSRALFRGHVMLLCYDNRLFSRSLHGNLLVWQYLGSKPQASDLVFLFIVSLAAMAAFHKLYPLGIGETDSVVDLQQTLQRDPHLLALYTYEEYSSSLAMAEEEEAASFKLFGTVILKGERQVKEEEDAAQVASGPGGAAEAAARVAAALPCPRCKSRETKFCYFNNYNVNQPRHFCRACHRYWTAGGALRNVPVGAGRRRGRPAHRGVGVSSGGGVLERPPRERLGGEAAEQWLLRPQAPARVDPGFDSGGLR
ncbi:uncharacterized protein LOC103996125 [Musa acuminata AAA Group]|uniref:uncharacterized protein LOC103996125 n=1 Tax=Musa acuminata AAA Group TaxID=214697 RepID=UPI0031DF4790